MAGFYIKSIIARSNSKEDAIVDFTSGLNIIQGRSDTGKSCVVLCQEKVQIKYALFSVELPC